MGGFACEDLDHVAVFELVVERDDAPVDLGADHGVADGGVDGVGEVDAFDKVAESYRLVVRCPMKLAKFLAYKGSVAINGVSLTINEVEDTPAGTRISINLIPHTFEHTAFKHTKKRDLVNVEVDTVARYIERMYSLTEHN